MKVEKYYSLQLYYNDEIMATEDYMDIDSLNERFSTAVKNEDFRDYDKVRICFIDKIWDKDYLLCDKSKIVAEIKLIKV